MLKHKSIESASTPDRNRMKQSFLRLLHSHARQAEYNALYKQQRAQQGKSQRHIYTPSLPFFEWVHTTAADHVAVGFPFAWSCCWISANFASGAEIFQTPREKYLSTAVERYLSTICRLYNDFGSVARDDAEGNVNSLSFPDFAECGADKEELKGLARFEEECLALALRQLDEEVSRKRERDRKVSRDYHQRKMSLIRLFADVADFYNQLYVVRDLSSRQKSTGGKH